MEALLQRLQQLYSDFMTIEPQSMAAIYAEDVLFRDPVHEMRGLPALQAYFEGISTNLISCEFNFEEIIEKGGRVALWWEMHYRHPRLNGGRSLSLRGNSRLHLDLLSDRVIFHEDYYDLGAMVYERIPLLGSTVRFVKSGLMRGGHNTSGYKNRNEVGVKQ
ncbi:nuclear transport factor 2 family protein [Microbulbifer celer]|uniref:Nuclear transport factor 2 family protein n=1 Tax=Microbulbifer celer TaxID=435905 RepID=A0ABW3U6F8_9GAMM|nr:nuclear transport factor 2 family protein [Microbulbifer celer]UFN58640.1 nuclear transport factor 2 family protein [Microbulbifer celer]